MVLVFWVEKESKLVFLFKSDIWKLECLVNYKSSPLLVKRRGRNIGDPTLVARGIKGVLVVGSISV